MWTKNYFLTSQSESWPTFLVLTKSKKKKEDDCKEQYL